MPLAAHCIEACTVRKAESCCVCDVLQISRQRAERQTKVEAAEVRRRTTFVVWTVRYTMLVEGAGPVTLHL